MSKKLIAQIIMHDLRSIKKIRSMDKDTAITYIVRSFPVDKTTAGLIYNTLHK